MALRLGTSTPSKLYLGLTEITKAYLGASEVYSSSWTPAELTGLALWLDADDASSITLNGSTVSQWSDKSGNNQHVVQATASAQPLYLPTTFNSKPTLYFDDTNDQMGCDVTNVSSQGDLFFGAAFQYLSDTNNWRPIVAHNTSTDQSNAGTLLMQRSSSRSEIGVHDSGRTDSGSDFTVQVTDLFEPRIATVGRNGGTLGDGGALTITATGPSQPTYITQINQSWPTTENTSRIQIGGRQQVQTGWANAYISEVIVCNTDLSTEDRQKLEGYLAWKWGLTANLPADHPYKSAPPTTSAPALDSDAQAYITAVETADGQALEASVKTAINNFVVGCKADGIWDAIKSSAILAGARTLSGALQPLVGTAPTNFNFVSGDYDRKTGLKGNGSTKYLNSNRNNNADPQDDRHVSIYANIPDNNNRILTGVRAPGTNVGGFEIRQTNYTYCNPSSDTSTTTTTPSLGLNFLGYSRTNSLSYTSRRNGSDSTLSMDSGTPISLNIFFYTRNDLAIKSNARISFYSIGESLDLALLDTRVTTLINAIGAAIP